MNNPILTISIAAYNVQSYLEQTLNSLLLKENFSFLEVLIVNDGSTDSTNLIAQKYVDKYPNVFKLINKENGGHGSTINYGIEHANGKYFKVLDGDDWVDTNELDKFLEVLKETDVDMILTDYTDVYLDDREMHIKEFSNYKDGVIYDASKLAWGTKVFLPTITIRTELLNGSNLRVTEHCFFEDMEYNVYCIYLSKTIMYKKMDIYRYRKGIETQSISFSSKRKNIKMTERIAHNLNQFYEENVRGKAYPQERCIEYHIVFIMYTAYVTYLSYSPNQETWDMLVAYINSLESKHLVNTMANKRKIFGIVYRMNRSYSAVATMYRLLKRIRV